MVCLRWFTFASSLFQFFMFILLIFLAELSAAILAFIFRENVSVPCGQAPKPGKVFCLCCSCEGAGEGAGAPLQLAFGDPALPGAAPAPQAAAWGAWHGLRCSSARGVLREPSGSAPVAEHTHTRRNCPADPATGFTAERERGPRRAAGSCRLPLPTLPVGSREKVQETVRLVRILPLLWDRGTHEDKLSYKIRSPWLFETSVASGCAL